MNPDSVMGKATPAHGWSSSTTTPAVEQSTIHDQFMMAALTGLLARGTSYDAEVLVQNAKVIANYAMRNRA